MRNFNSSKYSLLKHHLLETSSSYHFSVTGLWVLDKWAPLTEQGDADITDILKHKSCNLMMSYSTVNPNRHESQRQR